jgi:formamidopyrimidine-DNA glycosylase
MPELPEVETTRRGIEPLVAGRTVERVQVHNADLRWPVPAGLDRVLRGCTIRAVDRRAKYLLFDCGRGTMLVHLGMSGHLRVVPQGEPLRKHDHVEVLFDDGSVLRYNDTRRFGAILWTADAPELHPRLADLGPEPLEDEFDAATLQRLARGRRAAIKTLIMDARVVVGVGNIYASEALFRADIDPRHQAGRVSLSAFERLVTAIRDVLTEAIAAGGTTIRDFAASDGKPGYFVQQLRVYGRAGQPCLACGAPVKKIVLGQRSTYYCGRCQR